MDFEDDLRYFGGESTLFVWLDEAPEERRVLTMRRPDGSRCPSFTVARYLANRRAPTFLALFVRPGVNQEVLGADLDAFCQTHAIHEWRQIEPHAAQLAAILNQHEVLRQLNMLTLQPLHADVRLATGGSPVSLLEE